MKFTRDDIWPVIVGFLLVVTIAFHLDNIRLRSLIQAPQAPATAITAPEQRIMSVRELQAFLNDKGHSRYACGVDGRMGKETQRAWDNWIMDRYAKGEFE